MSAQHDSSPLDAGFWRATIVMGVISVVLMILVYLWPIDHSLREAANTAASIDFLFKFMAFFSVPILVYVNGYILYFAVRYRRRADEPMDAVGSPIEEHRGLETWWTVLPALLMLVLGIMSYLVMPQYYLAQAGTVTMEAIGHKWYYEFRYPGLTASVFNSMHLPVGVPLTLDVTAAEARADDAVIHAFWVPEFRVKQDMVPGMVVPIHFTPTQIGAYPIICTEFCGVGHSKMRGQVIVESQADFNKWFDAQKHEAAAPANAVALTGGDAAAGKSLFEQKCAACHNAAPFEQRKVGPGIGNLFHDPEHPKLLDGKPATPENVADIVMHGLSGSFGVMPNMQANALTQKNIADLVAYLKSLRS